MRVALRKPETCDERGERLPARRLDLQRQQRIGAGVPEVDCDDRLALVVRPHAEPIAGIHHQRRADDEHRVGVVERARGGRDALARHVLAEKYDGRLQQPAARGACGHAKMVERAPFEMRVAIGGGLRSSAEQLGILRFENVLDRRARVMRTAIETCDTADAAVQLDDVDAARALMQPVDVLRDEPPDACRRAEPRERMMRRVRLRAPDHGPAEHAARPVAAARMIGIEKLAILNRLRAHPCAVAVAIAGNAGIGTDARAREHEQARMLLDERMQRIERARIGKRRRVRRRR